MGAGADAGECSGNVAFARNGDAGCVAGNLVAAHVEAQCRANLTDDEPIAVMFDLVNPIGALQRERSPAPGFRPCSIMTNSSSASCRPHRRPPCPTRTGNMSRAWRFGDRPN
jgi:hypothetical protein